MLKAVRSVIAILIVGIAVLIGYFIATRDKDMPTEITKEVKTVFVETVKNTTIPIVIPANGNLAAKNRLELYAEVQGVFRSSSNDFKPGQAYKRGQTLLNLDSSEYYASVQAAKSDLYNLITSIMPDLRLDYPEYYQKWQNYLDGFDINKSTPELPETSSDKERYFITGRGIFSSYYNLKNLEQRLGKYRIIAPFSGILTEALVNKGTLVRSGQKLGEFIDSAGVKTLLAILLLVVGIAIAYDTFFAEQAIKEIVKIDVNNLNPLSMFIKKFSAEMPILYGLFSILFAITLGVGAAFIRRFFSNLRKKYLKKSA